MCLEDFSPNRTACTTQHMKNIFTTKRASIVVGIIVILGAIAFQLGHPVSKLEQNMASDFSKQEFTISAFPQGQLAVSPSSETKKYTHPSLGFSFAYPASFSISAFGSPYDGEGDTILLQSGEEEKGLQVLITSFDEDIPLTEERIHHDIPDLVMSDVGPRILGRGEKTVQAIVFMSTNSFMGKSREAWFVRGGLLYQISVPESTQDVLITVLDSWEF